MVVQHRPVGPVRSVNMLDNKGHCTYGTNGYACAPAEDQPVLVILGFINTRNILYLLILCETRPITLISR